MAKNTVTIKILGDASSANQALDGTTGKLGKLGPAAATAGAGVAAGVGLAGAALFKIGSDLDSAYDSIVVQTGATGATLEGLKGDFEAVATSIPASFESVGSAIAGVNQRLGLTGKPLQDVSAQLLELSRITDTDLGTNIESVTRAFGDWGVETGDMSSRLDQLFKASQATGPSVDRLAQLATQFGGPMRQLGFSFEDTVAMLGKFEKEGVNTELVMGAMRISLGKMARAGEDPIETFQRVTEQIKNAGSAGEANSIALELFGSKAGPDMAAAIREGRFEVDDLIATMADSEGAIRNTASSTDDWREKLQVLQNKVMLKLAPLAEKVFDAVGKAVEKATPFIEDMAVWFEDVLVPAIQKVIAWIQTNWPKFEAAIRTTMTWLVENVGPVIEEVFGYIEQTVGELILWFETNWPKIQETVRTVLDWIRVYMETMIAFYQKLWELFGERILAVVKIAWEYVRGAIENVLNVIKGIIQLVMGIITLDWDTAWGGIKKIVEGIWGAIRLIVETAAGLMAEVLKGIWTGIQATASLAWEGVKSAISAAWEGIKTAVSNAVDDVVGFVTGLPDRLLEFVGSVTAAGKAIGEAIIGGMADGLSASVDWFQDIGGAVLAAVKDAVNSVIRRVNSALEISFEIPTSPWTVQTVSIDPPDIPELHTGGWVGMPSGTPKDIPAILQQGEYVLSRDDVAAIKGRRGGGRGSGGGVYVDKLYTGTTTEETIEALDRLAWMDAGKEIAA